MSKHTPGPWIVLTQGTGVSIAQDEEHPDRAGGHRIAKMHSGKPTIHTDAALIAAAPDLLEALEASDAIVTILAGASGETEHSMVKRTAELTAAAIAKARGQS